MNVVDEELQLDVPMQPVNHIAMQVEEVPLDQLIDFVDEEVNLPDDLNKD